MKRILTVQDFSCVGKCSLTVALPIISAMGIECSALPTALLSNHTAFPSFTFLDLTNEANVIEDKMKDFAFDGIYPAYLGNIELIDTVLRLVDAHPGGLVFVDPVMGDNGVLYKGFTEEYPKKMRSLCAKADVIVPNETEAKFLLGKEIDDVPSALKDLCALGCDVSMITGVVKGDKTGVMAYRASTDEYFEYYHKTIDKSFHGTGDVFASALFGKMLSGASIPEALEVAVEFTCLSMEKTLADKCGAWYGVNFEEALPYLIEH